MLQPSAGYKGLARKTWERPTKMSRGNVIKAGASHFIKKFLVFMSGIYEVRSIFLKWLPLQSVEVSVERSRDALQPNMGYIL